MASYNYLIIVLLICELFCTNHCRPISQNNLKTKPKTNQSKRIENNYSPTQHKLQGNSTIKISTISKLTMYKNSLNNLPTDSNIDPKWKYKISKRQITNYGNNLFDLKIDSIKNQLIKLISNNALDTKSVKKPNLMIRKRRSSQIHFIGRRKEISRKKSSPLGPSGNPIGLDNLAMDKYHPEIYKFMKTEKVLGTINTPKGLNCRTHKEVKIEPRSLFTANMDNCDRPCYKKDGYGHCRRIFGCRT